MQSRDVPVNDKSIKVVDNLKDFYEESFGPEANVILLRRKLSADFNGAAADLQEMFAQRAQNFRGIKQLDQEELEGALLHANDETKKALGVILDDMRSLKEKWNKVHLRLIAPAEEGGYHTDGADAVLGRALCCYNAPTTEGLLPGETGKDEAGFCAAVQEATPFSFNVGDMWRNAGSSNKAKVPPFVHRAPASNAPRLLLVADHIARRS